MWKFNKYDVIKLSLITSKKTKKEPQEIVNEYSYIWEFDELEPLVLNIINKGKLTKDNELTYAQKNEKYILKLNSINQLDEQNKRLVDNIEGLKNNLKTLSNELKVSKETINSLQLKNEELSRKNVEETLKFKQEVLNIQAKAQEMVSEHKKKTTEHQEEQINEIKKYALQSFIEDLIMPLNNFELAILAAKKNDNPVLKNFIVGFEMLFSQIENKLFDIGLAKIEPKVGEIFNADFHQVYEVVTSDMEKDTILEVKNIGYKLNDRVIKPALVILSK
ncbi:nucleotide exchange factor GrpE [Mycoplasma enhydrae]|uniref:nucleotide exchange factor GrpE n=1 Tax=Mycoplasma enhydrae TaxID=2499220 RepID=UPI00197C937B|nr:nucleotide exchange factor GrpE [Mycoplasma enhydrae]MBN4089639.1 nucleotide exchange factor GrpE [Mycoplasma enhydrae]MCV3733767.1 nucleotide exchange factor GrpE [Mycoplasma enhydrae]MCV3753522.1 nucleotide exchange factor GrpE [Mycoplasma enhydrae]